jgi:hypothetical protein
MISLAPPRPGNGGCCDMLPWKSFTSAPVRTATTPFTALAAAVSIDLMSAAACGERTKTA